MIKLEYKQWGVTTYADVTDYIVELGEVSKKVESELAGDAGVIVFDNLSLTMKLEGGIINIFDETFLATKPRLMFLLSRFNYALSTFQTLYEGVVDLETIAFDRNLPLELVTFDVVDKMSYLALVEETDVREVISTIVERANIWSSDEEVKIVAYSLTSIYIRKYDQQIAVDLPSNFLLPGEMISFDIEGMTRYIMIEKFTLMRDDLDTYYYGKVQATEFEEFPLVVINDETIVQGIYGKEIYGVDCLNYDELGGATSYDVDKLLRAIIYKVWSDITIGFVISGMSLPLSYYEQLINSAPFGSNMLESFKYLADSFLLYVFINKNGAFIAKAKGSLTSGTMHTITPEITLNTDEKFFWDKIIDGIELTTKSYLKDAEGNYISKTVTLPLTGSAKNAISKEVLCSDYVTTEALLDVFVTTKAQQYLDFYGKKRKAFNITLLLNDDTAQIDILDNIDNTYFITSLEFSENNQTLDMEIVEINGINW